MKIALVTGEYPPMQGGVGAFTQEIGRAFARQKHEVHIITHRQARPKPAEQSQSLSEAWRRINDINEPVEIEVGHLHPRGRKWRWADVGMIADLTMRYEFDIVNLQYQAAAYGMGTPAIHFLPWRLRALTKTVITFHDLRQPYLFPKAGRLRNKALPFMAAQSAGVIATNQPDYDQLTAWMDGKDTAVAQIPIGSNITAHHPNHIELEEVYDTLKMDAEKDALLGYFGFLNESKGADTLIQALTKLGKKYHLAFVGGRTGSSDTVNNQLFLSKIDQLVAAYKLAERVHWTGYLSDRRVSAHLCAAEMMVLPYRDGVSLRRGTLMAALAHGCAIISTHPPKPIPNLVHGENIWLVPADDPAALAAAIKRLHKDDALRQKLGAGAEALSGRFSWARIAADTADFFQGLST